MSASEQDTVWPAGGGACGRAIREKDWSRHPLGPPNAWPDMLRSVVDAILASRFPMIVLWQRELFQVYNDGYAAIMGERHPGGMGQPTGECWPEAWHALEGIYNRVFTGETVDLRSYYLPLLRHGVLDDYYFDLSYSPLHSADGQVVGILVPVIDVTDQKKAEQALQLSNRRLNALVAATSYSTYSMNADWTEMKQMEGASFLASTARNNRNWLLEYVHPDDQEMVRQAVARAVASETMFELEHRVWMADGSLGWTESRAVPVRDEQGKVIEWFGAASDVTARKLSERALLENEKLAVVGRLASSIAHEINNPLEAVTNLLYLAQLTVTDEETREHLRLANAELERVSHITAATLRFHRQSRTPSLVNLNEVVDSVLTLHQGRLRSNHVKVEKRYGAKVFIICWPNEIRQVVANVVSNAIDAMKFVARPRLTVRTHAIGQESSSGAVILISDTGTGMSPLIMRRIFDPFFTTKEATGTGLGLWVSKNIMERHGGSIRVRSTQREGCEGTIFGMTFLKMPVLEDSMRTETD
jgi:signal transduction histidine kinase